MAFDLRCAAALIALTGLSSLTACFDVEDAPPLGTESTTGTPTTTEPGTTMEPGTTTPDPTTSEPESSTGPVDPDTSTGPVDPDTGSSSSGAPPVSACGDGVLDLDTETCDDGNREPGDLCDADCQVETVVLGYTGGVQMLDVPDWVDSLEVEAWGAQGGGSSCSDGTVQDDGGLGGEVTGVVPTIGGTTLAIRVGGQGVVDGAGGFNGGGGGGFYGGGGGGATDVRIAPGMLSNRLLVAAGGGGGNCGGPDHGAGGNGGGLSGQAGISNQGLPPGGGGTQAAGGAAGEYCTAGTLGQGGSAQADPYHVGGGGGGYYGGGGGYGAGGGGGSSYLGVLRNGSTVSGVREGHGELRLTPVAIQ
jgi:cysteine-rich repeat protein